MLQIMNNFHPFDFETNSTIGLNDDKAFARCQPTARAPSGPLDGVQPADVLCGRDKLSHSHVGNKRFRHIVMMHREAYQGATSREVKTNLTCKIIKIIRDYGGRFLKQNEASGVWEEVGNAYAREKVSHALRSAKDPNLPKVKKRREVKRYVPTPEEDRLFEATLADQQRIFQSLLAKEARGGVVEINFDTTDVLDPEL